MNLEGQVRFSRVAVLTVFIGGGILFGGSNFQAATPISIDRSTSQNLSSDTTAPIERRPCNSYKWFQDQTEQYWQSQDYGPLPGTHFTSLHAMTCKWAAYREGLSFDSTQLQKYVQPTGDSLRLSKDAVAYGLKMAPANPDRLDRVSLYLVAEVADSLFYREIGDSHPYESGDPSTVSIRAMRPIDVPGAESQHLWVEIEKQYRDKEKTPVEVKTRWRGHIFAYDPGRGMRYLHNAPVRVERTRSGNLVGAQQWDVSVPKPGIMKIEPRLRRGKVRPGRDRVRLANRNWLGKHVIDPSATSKREIDPKGDASNRTFLIDTTEVENWREKYQQ